MNGAILGGFLAVLLFGFAARRAVKSSRLKRSIAARQPMSEDDFLQTIRASSDLPFSEEMVRNTRRALAVLCGVSEMAVQPSDLMGSLVEASGSLSFDGIGLALEVTRLVGVELAPEVENRFDFESNETVAQLVVRVASLSPSA